jgi:CBS-domain-containing membrane protein
MSIESRNLPLSREQWTLARYLTERSPAPMPPVVRAGDDALHVAKLAVGAPLPRAVYVVDEDDRYLGTILDGSLARQIFEHLNPSLYLDKHPHAMTGLFQFTNDASKLTAESLMSAARRTMLDQETVAGAMHALHQSGSDELPVVNAEGQLVGVIRALDILREWVEDTLLVQLGDDTESFY